VTSALAISARTPDAGVVERSASERAARQLRLFAVIGGALAFLLMGTLRFVYFYLNDIAAGHPQMLVPRLINEGTGALFEAIVFVAWWWGYRRWLRGERRRAALFVRHLAAFAAVSLLHTGLMMFARSALYPVFGHGHYDTSHLPMRFLSEMGNDVVGYASMVAVVMAYESYVELRRRAAAEQALKQELALVELELLRLQLQPHFLFNALNTIAATMYEDLDTADELITGLAALLRASVRGAARQIVPLSEELALADHYVQMMRARFGDRVEVRFDVSAVARDREVPSMLLQPLLENALHHGEPPVGGRSVVQVEATATALGTTIVVRNRIEQVLGSAMAETVAAAQAGPAPRASGLGIGLQATRRRLAILYPDGTAKLGTSLSDDAYVVTIHLPHTTGSRLPATPAGRTPRDNALSALSARPA
jgi:hypothetical protein